MRCLSCQYDLRNLTPAPGSDGRHRCPECGVAFDPNDPLTFAPHAPPGVIGWRGVVVIAIVAYILSYLFMLPLGQYPRQTRSATSLQVWGIVAKWSLFLWPIAFAFMLAAWLVVRRCYRLLSAADDRHSPAKSISDHS